ncbi:hypothetical protein L3556_16055 [Candidatus Synechococcus calcipolaris G9]|uniref:Uncharacterized protein n=2 Tax=Synechococcus TaxID=1129 RepID=A0ABT6F3I3_9SYNE|nr:hypothetical protein [Candidatus Synechococcus calcipolaris G9]
MLLSYLDGSREVSYPERRVPRPDPAQVLVPTFNPDFLAEGKKLIQEVNSQRFVAPITTYVNAARCTLRAGGDTTGVRLRGFLAPRVSIVTGRQAQSENRETSKLTGQSYIKYGGQGVVVPFGPATETETEMEAVAAILNTAKAANIRNLVSYIPGTVY